LISIGYLGRLALDVQQAAGIGERVKVGVAYQHRAIQSAGNPRQCA